MTGRDNIQEQDIVRAIGEELKRARSSAGWSRPELLKRMRTPAPVNTYAGYEQGIRQCSIPRLVEICEALGVSVTELLSLALQRIEYNLESSGVRIDLHKAAADESDDTADLRQWAHNRLTTDHPESGVVHLTWPVVRELAIMADLPLRRMLDYIRDVAPDAAVQQR